MLLKAAAAARAPRARCRSTCASPATARRRSAATRSSTSSQRTSAAPTPASSSTRHDAERDEPAFYIATRGLAYFHVRVRTGERDLHSGVYGGAALNAIARADADARRACCRATAGCRSRSAPGSRRRPRRSSPTGRAAAGRARCSPSQGARPLDARAAEEFYLRTWAEPSVDVNGIEGGLAAAPEDGAPRRAREANFSIRLAPGQDLDDDRARGRAAAARGGARGRRGRGRAAGRPRRPASSPPDSPAIQLGLDAFERALGMRPLLSAPAARCRSCRRSPTSGIPTIVTGFDLPEANIHSPNERLLVEYVPLGVAAARSSSPRSPGLR